MALVKETWHRITVLVSFWLMSYDEKDIDDVRGTRIVLSIDKRVSNLLSRALKFDTKAYRQLSRPLKSQHYQHSL